MTFLPPKRGLSPTLLLPAAVWAFYKAEFSASDALPFAGWILKWRRL